MNGLYAKIMSMNEIANVIDPIDVLKSYMHYKNIKAIETTIEIINNKIENNNQINNNLAA